PSPPPNPDTVTLPLAGRSRPARIRNSVVFPAPLGPKRTSASPPLSVNETPLRTSRFLKRRVTDSTTTDGDAAACRDNDPSAPPAPLGPRVTVSYMRSDRSVSP